jgi:hypothetical protein
LTMTVTRSARATMMTMIEISPGTIMMKNRMLRTAGFRRGVSRRRASSL